MTTTATPAYAADLDSIRAAQRRIDPFIRRTPVLTSATLDALSGPTLIAMAAANDYARRAGLVLIDPLLPLLPPGECVVRDAAAARVARARAATALYNALHTRHAATDRIVQRVQLIDQDNTHFFARSLR